MIKLKRFGVASCDAAEYFFKNGFVILSNIVEAGEVESLGKSIHELYLKMRPDFVKQNTGSALSSSREIVENSQLSGAISSVMKSENLLDCLQVFLGPDISMIDHVNLWINDPADSSVVTNKSLHQEIWSGCGIEDLTVWIPISKVDSQNSMEVIPASHFYGLMPNRNRKLLPVEGFEVGESLILSDLDYGDVVIFHPLLLHGTAGRSDNYRYSFSAAYKNSYAPTSRKYQSIGAKGLRFGPLSKINHVLGNDYLTPLRTYGGKISNHPDDHERQS